MLAVLAVSCRFPNNKTVSAGGSEELSAAQYGVKASADVVFVVEENSCNSWAQRSLPTLATELEQALKARGELFATSLCLSVCLSVCGCLRLCDCMHTHTYCV